MNTRLFIRNAVKATQSHSPEILTALGITGVVTTSYLTAKASFKAARILNQREEFGLYEDPKQALKESTKLVWKFYIPAGASGIATIGCIFGAQSVSLRRTAAAATAYSIAERTFSEYREKVIDEIGKTKEQRVRDGVAQERVSENPPSVKEIVITSGGNVMCCELFTHRYFRSDMETLRKIENRINARIVNEIYVTLEEFYDLIGLPHTSVSNKIGWDSNKLMELQFSTVMSEGGEPCLAFDYNYTKPI